MERRCQCNIVNVLREFHCHPRVLHTAEPIFKSKGIVKIFLGKDRVYHQRFYWKNILENELDWRSEMQKQMMSKDIGKYVGKSRQTPTVKKIMSTVCVCGGGWRRKSQNWNQIIAYNLGGVWSELKHSKVLVSFKMKVKILVTFRL